MGETEGAVKILADARTDRILGVHILGPHASDLIAEAALAIEFGGQRRGHRAHAARPPDAARGDQGSGAGGRQARDPHLALVLR